MTRERRRSSAFRLFEGHRVPPPPPELAAETLALARLAGDAGPPRDWMDRLWESTVARWLWVAVTSCLLAANLSATRAPAVRGGPAAASIGRAEVAELVGPATLRWYGPQRGAGGGHLEPTSPLAWLLVSGDRSGR